MPINCWQDVYKHAQMPRDRQGQFPTVEWRKEGRKKRGWGGRTLERKGERRNGKRGIPKKRGLRQIKRKVGKLVHSSKASLLHLLEYVTQQLLSTGHCLGMDYFILLNDGMKIYKIKVIFFHHRKNIIQIHVYFSNS